MQGKVWGGKGTSTGSKGGGGFEKRGQRSGILIRQQLVCTIVTRSLVLYCTIVGIPTIVQLYSSTSCSTIVQL